MDFDKVYNRMIMGGKYFTSKELMYDRKIGILMNPYDYKQFLDYKDSLLMTNSQFEILLKLKSFNGQKIHFSQSYELNLLLSIYLKSIIEDRKQNQSFLSLRNADDITLSRIYSEVEGTLNIESVPTTHKAVDDIAQGKRDPKTLNEQTIKNMIKGIEFVNACPEFNEKNLNHLYHLLSDDCLSDDNKLLENNIYRHDAVEVGKYNGCPVEQIKECMNSLFEFVKDNMKNSDIDIFLPHIVHYYVLYVHPYFDYNGRTARMCSYWISLLMDQKVLPPVVSEAINQTKNQYYYSISETRDAHNDLTYFLIYIYDISIKYFFAYKNLEEIDQMLKNELIVLTNTEKAYFKKILISNKGKFTHGDFVSWIGVRMTKQGALKVLNAFEDYGLLSSEMSRSNNKLFEVNQDVLKYTITDNSLN